MKTTSYLEEPSRHLCQRFMRRTTPQTFSAINLASQQKTPKLFFSSQERKQFKLSTVPLKPLRCCLRSDKLVNCRVWKFYKDLFWNSRVIWPVNQIVLFHGFLSDFIEITSCVYTKTIIFFQSRWILALGIFTAPLSFSNYSPWSQRVIVNYWFKIKQHINFVNNMLSRYLKALQNINSLGASKIKRKDLSSNFALDL